MNATVSDETARANAPAPQPPPATPRRVAVRRAVWHWCKFNSVVLAIYVLVVVIWQLVIDAFSIPRFILPSPLAIIDTIIGNPGRLATNLEVTLEEVVIGFLIAAAVSIPLGVLLVYSRLLERVIYPALVAFQASPKVAFAPILVVWFGFGSVSKIVLALVTAVFPIVINTAIGMNQMPREMNHLLRSLGASPWQIFAKARLPVASPYIFGGFRIGITLAVVGAVVGEFIASNHGLGFLLLVANNDLDMPLLFAVVVVLSIVSSALFFAIEAIEAIVLPRPLRAKSNALDPGVNS